MIHAIISLSKDLSDEFIKDTCLQFNIKASRLDSRTPKDWCLETEDAANFFKLGLNFQEKVDRLF